MDNYKEKYEAALAVAQKTYNTQPMYREWLESMFPELKESEDERIRKALIHLISEQDGFLTAINGVSVKDIIAWLKKQGEQKPAEEYNITGINSKKAQGKLGEMIKNLKPVNEVLEQKPADKFPKYKKGDVLTDGKNKYEVLSWDYTETGIAAYYMKGTGCKFSWNCEEADKELYIVEQKPTWSEKDREMARFIGNAITTEESSDYLKQKNIEVIDAHVWLDSLKDRVQPKQEWSENDEIALDDALWCCKQAASIAKDENDMGNVWYAETWLKSLKDRYTYKPSDEQMKQLGWIAEQNKDNMIGKKLMTLYNDLKKLREE